MSEFVSIECAWKAAEQQSGYYNFSLLENWKHTCTETYGSRFSTKPAYLALPPKMQPFVWPQWAMSTPFPLRKSRRKGKLKKRRRLPPTFQIHISGIGVVTLLHTTVEWLRACLSEISLFCMLKDFLFKLYCYHPTAPRRVQITPKSSTNFMRYLFSRGPVRQVCLLLTNQLARFPAPIPFRFAYFCPAFPVNISEIRPQGLKTLACWMINLLLDVFLCNIAENFYSLFVFWLALWARQNTSQLVKILSDTTQQNV